MWHINRLKIFRQISFNNLSAFYEIDSKNNHLIVDKFYLLFQFLIWFVSRLSSFTEVTIFYVYFCIFKEELLKSIHEPFFLFFRSSFHIFELFKKKSMELVMRIKGGSKRFDCLFLSLFLFELLSLILDLFLFDHNKFGNWVF